MRKDRSSDREKLLKFEAEGHEVSKMLRFTKHSDFQKLWEVLMIRATCEAICETTGSMINQHCGKIGSFNQKISIFPFG